MSRRVLLAWALIAWMLVAGLVAGPAQARRVPPPAAPAQGTYVPLAAPVRAVDTRTGAGHNHRGAVPAGAWISPSLTGRDGIPARVAALQVTLSAYGPGGDGGLTVWTTGPRPATTNLSFRAGHDASGTTLVTVAGGHARIANTARRGSVQIAVDVLGYYSTGASDVPGGFHPVRPARVLDTRGGAPGALAPGEAYAATLGGRGGVPASGAGEVVATVTAVGAQAPGTLLGYRPGEPRQDLPILHFTPGAATSALAVLRLSGAQAMIANDSAGPVHVTVDVLGWYGLGFAAESGMFQSLVPTVAARLTLPAGATRRIGTAGVGGVPRSEVSAVLVTLHALAPARPGTLQAWGGGRPPDAPALTLSPRAPTSDTLLVPVDEAGTFAVRNTSAGAVPVLAVVDGYVPASDVPDPARVSTARYLDDLTGDPASDRARMDAHGCDDAGAAFVLLDVGAQSVTGPQLAADHPGVALAKTDPVVRVTYPGLVGLVHSYLDGYRRCSDAPVTVAVGTSNDGGWDPAGPNYYAPDARGTDWASEVVVPLDGYRGAHVVAGDDVEGEFAGTAAQAALWKASYLAAVPGTGTALVLHGSADGCPMTWTPGAECGFGWAAQDYYDLAAGPRTAVAPQVFFGYMATQWAMIDRTGGGGLRFAGTLSEHALDAGTLAPEQSRAALYRALSSVGDTPPGEVAADIS